MAPKVSVIIPVYNVEKYIRKMLESVRNQRFKDFEVLIINDGSTDNSQDIIDEFCAKDSRFKSYVQENAGVAATRNVGIEKAVGDYIVFYDPDDFIPRKAIGKMYKAAINNNADIAIGIMKEVRAGESRCNSHTIQLGKKEIISKYDTDLLWSFSVCNKIFKREFINSKNIRFPMFKHAEDALFLFESIFNANKITGCKEVVYDYQFRPFWESKSATQIIQKKYLLDVIESLDSIEDIIKRYSADDKTVDNKTKAAFLDEFYARYCEISVLGGYYRQLWTGEEEILDIISNKMRELKNRLSEARWLKICDSNRDLQLEKDLYDKASIKDNAMLTFILPENLKDDEENAVLQNIYEQGMPSFKVTMAGDNVQIDTPYVMPVNKDILFSKNSIRIMINTLIKNDKLEFVSAPLNKYENGGLVPTTQQAAFTIMQCLKNNRSRHNRMDDISGNKIFVADKYKVDNPYDDLTYKKIYNASMILKGEDNKSNIGLGVRFKLLQRKLEIKAMNYIKNRYTKEDIKRVLRREI
ncbi:MAG: glycosyltransferase family 2 protein [Bacillota bacterium]|nr:glycosyltransferase family 2 protein [Bacillota bacterium]